MSLSIPHRRPVVSALLTPWAVCCAALIGLYLARGVVLLCVLPPSEGWDEYEHVAYVQFLIDRGHAPIVRKSLISKAVVAQAVRFPMPEFARAGLGASGGTSYAQYWRDGGPAKRPAISIQLYEAQHPSLYYWLAVLPYRWAGGAARYRNAVGVLRAANLGLTAAGLSLFLWWLGKACRSRATAALIGAWAVTQPTFLVNSVRVANDSLAVTLGIATVVWATSLGGRRLLWHAAGLGLLAGAATLAKTINLALLPLLACCVVVLAARRRATAGRAALALGIIGAGFALVTGRYFYFNLRTFHMLTPLGEALENRLAGRTWRDFLPYLKPSIFRQAWWNWWVSDGLWTGGWSFLRPPLFLCHLYGLLVALGAAGWWFLGMRKLVWRRRGGAPGPFADPALAIEVLVLCGSLTLAMSYHALQSMVFYKGAIATEPWYTEAAVPFFLALVAGGISCWRPRPLYWILGACGPALFLVVEVNGVVNQMVPEYAQLPWTHTALRRLATLHPHWLGVPTLAAAIFAAAIAAVVAVSNLCHVAVRERAAGAAVMGANAGDVAVPRPV